MSDTDQNTDRLPEKTPEDVQSKTDNTSATASNSEKQAARKGKTSGSGGGVGGGSGKGLAGFALLISACALGLGGYIGWRAMPLEQSQPVLREGMDQLQTQIARQQARLTTLAQNTSTDIEQQKEQLHTLQQREARLLSRIDTLATKVRELEGSTRNQWRIAEVEYLLRLANQRLLTVNDVTGALELMASAEQILEQLDDYGLFPVREALAEDMAVLKATALLNQEGTWLRLQAIADLIPDLVILDENHITDVATALNPGAAITDQANPATDGTWQETIKAILLDTWHHFTSLFRINTQREQPIEVLLTPEQDQLIRQKMLMLIEQSKLALITGQQSIYQNSLQQTSDWLNRYFMLGGEVSNQLATELADLEGLAITPKMPNIHRSLEALKDHQSSTTIAPTLPQDNDSTIGPEENPQDNPQDNPQNHKTKPLSPEKDNEENSKPVTDPVPGQPAEQGVQIS
ncbi:uroporphyrinogen-III C-methyltransferase [Endozoicomonas sp. SCSIO W0465]|uniref:uroporphyrinogen-III C-methyltransferase n=1 Tax=Endozoicomonas sp. SCSIO W0465 TaxID=2918516 RepID=UPI002075EC1B|nr:uroporphyrinogen-III C-methyltransferase [Endozoicomonas sp. SCSIO W0465]USE36537.1 uroporphyrinogen-III C-methyltransferase [Endozoicomonas sp. SCSIO W0465]